MKLATKGVVDSIRYAESGSKNAKSCCRMISWKGKIVSGRSLGSDRCMIHVLHTMYDTLIDVYPSLPVDLEFIVLLLASILLAVIVTAKLDFLLWHATDCIGKLPFGLYIIIIGKTCFACAHF